MARKDAMNAAAKGELNSGGGTYDVAQDSLEAVRDRGDAAWVTATGFETAGAAAAALTAYDGPTNAELTSGLAAVPAAVDVVLTAAHDAGSWGSSLGSGAKAVTVAVVDGAGLAVPNVVVTVKNSAQTADIAVQTTNSTGSTPSAFGLAASTAYKFVLSGVDSGYTYSNPYSATTAAGVGTETITLTVAAAVPGSYCTVECAEEIQNGDYPEGHFWITAYRSPATRMVGGTKVDITYGPDECDISPTTGKASLQILQGAVVTLRVKTANETLEKADVVIPASAGPVNWNDLVPEA
jgi:hypothetical protein